jgi:site-specific DNA-methyltransferase (adenine-specific)/modification methylase
MVYLSTRETSINWDVSERRVIELCINGRIPGAVKHSKSWKIPKDSCKPIDKRVKSGNFVNKNLSVKSIDDLRNLVIQDDCLVAMKYIPSHSIDMILCDLPYGTTQNKWDSVIPLKPLWKEYKRIIKPNGAIVLTSAGMFTAQLMTSQPDLFKYRIIWIKSKPTNFLNAKHQPLRKYEDICVFYNKQPTFNPQMTAGEAYDKGYRKNQLSGSYGDFTTAHVQSDGQRYPVDLVYFKTAESEGPVWHPTQKPIELGRYLIRTYTKPGDIVLDNACGSGSFLVSAVLEGRNFIGIEKNEDVALFKKDAVDYIQISEQRVLNAYKDLSKEKKATIMAQGVFKPADGENNNNPVK